MFQLTKQYTFILLEDDGGETAEVTYPYQTVVDIDGPLLKLNAGGEEMIVNTHSPRFVRALIKK